MNNNFKIYIFIATSISFFLFNGCKTTEKTKKTTPVEEKAEITERDELKSTVLLIDASKEKMLGNPMKAISLYSEAFRINPKNAAAAFELAKLHARGNHVDDAIAYSKKAIEIDPQNQHYLLLLAEIFSMKGKMDEALKINQKVADMHPKDLNLQFNLLSNYIILGKYDKVIDVFNHIETLTGFSDELSIEKIQLFLEMELYDKAIEETKKLISYFPEEHLYKEYLAEIYTQAGQKEKAIEIYHEILEKDPDYALARLQLAEHYRQQGDMQKSFEELKKAFKSHQLKVESKGRIMFAFYSYSLENPDYLEKSFILMDILIEMYPEEAELYTMYGDFYLRDDKLKQARDKFIKSVELDPNQYPVWEQAIYISSKLEEYELVIKHSEKALDYFFEQPVLYFFNGVAHFQLEKYEKAIDAFENGIVLVVDNKQLKGQFYTMIGDTYYKLNEYKKSFQSYENALEIDSENTFALNNYSYYLALQNKNLEFARQMSEKANNIEKNNPAYLDTYGWIMYKMGDYEESKKWIKKAIENLDSDNATIFEHYGDVLYKIGRKDDALKYWKKAGQMDNGSEFLEKKIKDGKLYE